MVNKSCKHLFQIVYSQETRSLTDERFPILDNINSLRPDWYEYWPIREYFIRQKPRKDQYYGFFSPRLSEKTGLTLESINNIIEHDTDPADVYTFSPQPDMGAFFLNVFEQADTFDPGFKKQSEKILQRIGISLSFDNLVMDSRTIVFSNYIAAKGNFWLEWLQLCEKVFKLAEEDDSADGIFLRSTSTYSKGAHMKVFLIERIASLMLSLNRDWKVRSANTFRFAWSASKLREHPEEAIISDALKMAFNEVGHTEYMSVFAKIRDRFQQSHTRRE